MNILFLGPPGAGKGTHAVDFSKKLGIPHISTGDILREAVKNQTAIGKKAKEFMDRGELVPDEIVVDVVIDRLKEKDCKKGFILDGFPRNLAQAEMLSGRLHVELDAAVYFETSKKMILMRLTGRRLCKKCGAGYHVKNIPPKVEGKCDQCGGELYQRPDDNPETVEHRLEVYDHETKALLAYYKKRKLLITVTGDLKKSDGTFELDGVFAALRGLKA